MGYKSPHMYTLPFACAASTPADITAYFLGNTGSQLNTTSGYGRVLIPKSGRIVWASLWIGCTAGTNEATVIAINVNGATDYVFDATVDLSVSFNNLSNALLNIPVVAGDYIQFKITTPAWATNPTSVGIRGIVFIECE